MRMILCQQGFEFLDHRSPEYMFQLIGITINMAGRDVGMGNQIQFPETVIANHPLRFVTAGFGKKITTIGTAMNPARVLGMTQ